jgi:CRISPR/Cas system CSM-associated protein Csm3 (group 7 of RAMP superfamily)
MIDTVRLVAESPIVHSGFGAVAGNAMLLRRIRLPSIEGAPRIPCVSGNALRGICRRLLMREMLDRAGVSRETLHGPVWDRLYGAVVNGGHLDSSERSIRPEEIRSIRSNLPQVSVFGAAFYSWMLAGHVSFGILWPRCIETSAAGVVAHGPEMIRGEELVEELSQVRLIDREHQDPEASGVTPMPVTMEAIAPGTVLESTIIFAPHASELERSAVAHALSLVQHIGGKSASGYGRVRMLRPPTSSPEPYRAMLEEQQDAIRAAVLRLAKELTAAPPAKPSKRGKAPAAEPDLAGEPETLP